MAKPSDKPHNLLKLLLFMQQRSTGRASAQELAATLDVSEKSIKRWVLELGSFPELGGSEPVLQWVSRGRNGRSEVTLGRPALHISPSIYNYAAVFLATRHLAVMGDLDVLESANIVMKDLVDAGIDRRLLDRIHDAFHYLPFGPKQYDDSQEATASVLFSAVVLQHVVDTDYTPRGQDTVTRQLHPFTLVVYRDGLYVVARHGLDGPVGVFALDRFTRVETTTESFDIPKDFSPSSYFGHGLGLWRQKHVERVVLRFDPAAAQSARERTWPGLVGWSEAEDGRAQLDLNVAATPEVVSWVLGWGEKVEVVEPTSLRQTIADRVRATLGLYC